MTYDRNPFPAGDADRHALWEMLVRRDIDAFIGQDWAMVENDFVAESFFGMHAHFLHNADAWRLQRDHFYDAAMLGTIIKNPLEYVFSMLNATASAPAFDLATNYDIYLNAYNFSAALGMDYFRPPSVGGWTSYYQAPSYSRLWANSSYIKLRFDVAAFLTMTPGVEVNGHFFKINALNLVDGLSDPSNPVHVIDDIAVVFCPKGLSTVQKLMLKQILTNGLPDFEWTVQYNDYVANSGNATFSDPVRLRVELLLFTLFQMPEFQTI